MKIKVFDFLWYEPSSLNASFRVRYFTIYGVLCILETTLTLIKLAIILQPDWLDTFFVKVLNDEIVYLCWGNDEDFLTRYAESEKLNEKNKR